jgi:hypothetical protein
MTPLQKWHERTKAELRTMIATQTLRDLHAFGKLDIRVVNSIGKICKVDAAEICSKQGITYDKG